MPNAVDGFTSDLVVRGENPRRLTDAALATTARWLHRTALVYLTISVAGFVVLTRRWAFWAMGAALKPAREDQIHGRGPSKSGVMQALPGLGVMVLGHAILLAQRDIAAGGSLAMAFAPQRSSASTNNSMVGAPIGPRQWSGMTLDGTVS